jgi:hypothetical protein
VRQIDVHAELDLVESRLDFFPLSRYHLFQQNPAKKLCKFTLPLFYFDESLITAAYVDGAERLS